MFIIQNILGYLIVFISIIYGVDTGNILEIIIGVAAGLLLISAAKALEYLKDIRLRSLGVPLSAQQIRTIRMNTNEIKILSDTMEITPKEAMYPVLKLDDAYYLRVKALSRYITQEARTYTFAFPNREPLEITCAINYYPGTDMFALDEQAYINIDILKRSGLKVNFNAEGLVIENS